MSSHIVVKDKVTSIKIDKTSKNTFESYDGNEIQSFLNMKYVRCIWHNQGTWRKNAQSLGRHVFRYENGTFGTTPHKKFGESFSVSLNWYSLSHFLFIARFTFSSNSLLSTHIVILQKCVRDSYSSFSKLRVLINQNFRVLTEIRFFRKHSQALLKLFFSTKDNYYRAVLMTIWKVTTPSNST